ncbi:MAG: hypothetical protein AAFU64_08885 [Bacteroidota bacterium]
MYKKTMYLLFGLALLGLRLMIHFSQALIPGINGGYYPLQVRSILEKGHLGFPDMPLYFYLNAGVVQVISFFSTRELDQVIIFTSKILDSCSLSFLMIPLYLIQRDIIKSPLSTFFEISLLAFATLSFAPIFLTADLQKNSFALPLMLFHFYYLFLFFQNHSFKKGLLALLFLLAVGLTHFGVFSVTMLVFLLSLFYFYGRRAFLPMLGLALMALLLIYGFDAKRAYRLLSIGTALFHQSIFRLGWMHIPALLHFLLNTGLIAYVFFQIRENPARISHFQRKLLQVLASAVFILSFPLIEPSFMMRLILIIFLPQVLLLSLSYKYLFPQLRQVFSGLLLLMAVASLSLTFINPKQPTMSREAYADLLNLKEKLNKPDQTLITARHGWEWWIGWQIRCKIGQARALRQATFSNYSQVIHLQAAKQQSPDPTPPRGPFQEPFDSLLNAPFYHSDYFKTTELKREDLQSLSKRRFHP